MAHRSKVAAVCAAAVVTISVVGVVLHLANGTAPTLGLYAPHRPTEEAPLSVVVAFPGAEGFGAAAVGGRGGKVLEVTNLDDSGPGSLRQAVSATGARTVVFRIGGTIELLSGLEISSPFITIAGQTAPGDGIALKNHPDNPDPTLTIVTHDVVLRYLRLRPGPSREPSSSLDALLISGGHDIVIDHCSFSWATRNVVSTWYEAYDVTLQWNIIAEGLDDSTHIDGPHSVGLLLGSEGSRRLSVHHNLFAHHGGGTPSIKTGGVVDLVNNVIYNTRYSASHVDDAFSRIPLNVVGNVFLEGPDSQSQTLIATTSAAGRGLEIYLENNFSPPRTTSQQPDARSVEREGRRFIVPTPHYSRRVSLTPTEDAVETVVERAGATLPRRDAADRRIVDDVRNRSGTIVDAPADVGGWPELEPGDALPDSDHDGMPDDWERAQGFDPENAADGALDDDADGYTNLEEYLHQLELR